MDILRRKSPSKGREIYYYDTSKEFEAAELAARLYMMMREEFKKGRKNKVLVLCIGTDRSTGDSLGPLIGYQLRQRGLKHIHVVGTLNKPVHAMNLPLLYWAGEELGDPRFMEIAKGHTDKALEVLLRPDGSCNHIAVLDPRTGELLENPGGQGFGPGSSWSRGQAWALYGLGLAYVHTKDNRYLDRAKQAAHYFIAQVALTGYVSLADFRAPKEPVYWDTTAAACGACGLLQIAGEVPEGERYFYYDAACRILMALEEKHCCWDKETDGILMDGTAAYGKMEETHVSLIYGDYFFVEGILRLMGRGFLIW